MAGTIQDNALPFADTVSRLASDHDVLMCYQLLLGRDPEDSFVIQEAKTQQLRWIFDGFVRSAEFADRVSRPFAQGEPLAHDAESLGPSAEQLAWLKQTLKLNRKAASAVTAARSWRALFAVLFTLPGFGLVPQPSPSQLLGAINSLTGNQVSGWCIDFAGSGSVVTLAVLADGDVIGQCECHLPRPDVQVALGGDGRCGFAFEIPEPLRERALVLSAQEAKSGTAVLGPFHIPASQAALSNRLAVLQGQMGQIDTLMRQVIGELPSLASEMRLLARVLSAPSSSPSPQTTGSTDHDRETDRVVGGV